MPRSGERGAALVEAALVLPIIFLVIVGMIDAGRWLLSQTMLAYAVTVGARSATANANSQADVQNAVSAAAPMLSLTPSTVLVTTTAPAGAWSARATGSTVSVTASYAFVPSNPLFTRIGSRTFTYKSTMTIP